MGSLVAPYLVYRIGHISISINDINKRTNKFIEKEKNTYK